MKGRNTRKMISIIALGISLMLLIVFVAPAGMMSQVYATEDRKENEEEEVSENHTKVEYLERSSDRMITDDTRADKYASHIIYMESIDSNY